MAKDKEISLFWIIIKFVTPVVVLLSFIPSPTGKPFIDWKELLPDADTQKTVAKLINIDVSDVSIKNIESTFTEKKTTVYKWKDNKGQWHFSEEQPLHLKAQTVVISNKVNTIQAPSKINSDTTQTANPSNNSNTLSTNTLPYGNVKQLMQDAKNLQNLADDRSTKLNNF